MVDEEKFFAWLDGELPADEAARVEAEVAADPELSRLAEEHREMDANLKGAFDTVAAAPVPERIAAAARARRDNVVDLAAHREKRRAFLTSGPQWAAMAAALAIGVALGTTLQTNGTSGPVEVSGGSMYAASAVDRALDTQLASANNGNVRVGLTFRDQQGVICRTFATAASTGLACRESDRWKLRGLFAAPAGQGENYRMAAGADPRLMDMVDETIAGEPFDAAREQAARDKGWK